MEARFAELAAKFGYRSSLLAFLLTLFINMVSYSLPLSLSMNNEFREHELIVTEPYNETTNASVSRHRPHAKFRPKMRCFHEVHILLHHHTISDMKRTFRPDQESKCLLAEFTHMYRCLFATRNCSYLTGITFKLSMAFVVNTPV